MSAEQSEQTKKQITVKCKNGLHVTPIVKLSKVSPLILIEHKNKTYKIQNIFKLLSACIPCMTSITVICNSKYISAVEKILSDYN